MVHKSERQILHNIEEVDRSFLDALKQACSSETCYPKVAENWSFDNPLWGHCAVVTEIARRNLGGEIVTAIIKTSDGQSYYHYWNRLSDGIDHDFTITQYKNPIIEVKRVKVKKQITDRDTLKRVKIFEEKLLSVLSQ